MTEQQRIDRFLAALTQLSLDHSITISGSDGGYASLDTYDELPPGRWVYDYGDIKWVHT